MLEKAFSGSRAYWIWMGSLATVVLIGLVAYLDQFSKGFTVTGMGRDTPWGIYIAQFTFLVGIAASAVMVVLPTYLHDYKAFGSITLLGEFMAIGAVIICMLFIIVDIGHPNRALNLILHPSPNSPIFWDTIALSGYLILNIVISMRTLQARAKGVPPPGWLKAVIVLSIPWAFSIHTVTAFMFAGLAARPFWMTAVLAPRFLASAFATGPALLILVALVLGRVSAFRVPARALAKLAEIITYALIANLFFLGLELFTALYSDMPHHTHAFEYLYFGLDGHTRMVPIAWISLVLTVAATAILLLPRLRGHVGWLAGACGLLLVGLWLDKGVSLVITGWVPNPFDRVVEYAPSLHEVAISLGLYALGAFIFSVLCKIYLAYQGDGLARETPPQVPA